MSHKFIPYTSLLNSIYIPFYENLKKNIFGIERFSIETNNQGMQSIINLNGNNTLFPFIDLLKYDYEKKDWFFYDNNGFPYRFNYNDGVWKLEAIYGIPNINAQTESSFVPLFYSRDIENLLGIYTTVYDNSQNEYTLYKGSPILVSIENQPLTDITDYSNVSSKPKLNFDNAQVNKEFYYDVDQNRIITNQNLTAFNENDIVIAFYSTPSTINVKARFSSNEKSVSDITPVVDYYIIKLSGQNLRG